MDSDGYAPFVNAFWSRAGEETLLSHINASSTTLNDLRVVFKELFVRSKSLLFFLIHVECRASLEGHYAKQLKKISMITIGKEEIGLASTLTEFKASLLARSEMHEKLSSDVSSLEAKVKEHEAARDTRKRKVRPYKLLVKRF